MKNWLLGRVHEAPEHVLELMYVKHPGSGECVCCRRKTCLKYPINVDNDHTDTSICFLVI